MVKLVNPSDSLWMFAIALHRMIPVSSICYNQEPHFQLRNFPWCKLWWSRSLWLCCKWIEGPSARSWRCGGPISDLSHKMNAFTEKHSHRSSSLKHICKDNKGSWHSRLEWVYDNCHLSYLIQIILSELSFTLSRAGSTCFFHNLPVVFCKSDRCSWKKNFVSFQLARSITPSFTPSFRWRVCYADVEFASMSDHGIVNFQFVVGGVAIHRNQSSLPLHWIHIQRFDWNPHKKADAALWICDMHLGEDGDRKIAIQWIQSSEEWGLTGTWHLTPITIANI